MIYYYSVRALNRKDMDGEIQASAPSAAALGVIHQAEIDGYSMPEDGAVVAIQEIHAEVEQKFLITRGGGKWKYEIQEILCD